MSSSAVQETAVQETAVQETITVQGISAMQEAVLHTVYSAVQAAAVSYPTCLREAVLRFAMTKNPAIKNTDL